MQKWQVMSSTGTYILNIVITNSFILWKVQFVEKSGWRIIVFYSYNWDTIPLKIASKETKNLKLCHLFWEWILFCSKICVNGHVCLHQRQATPKMWTFFPFRASFQPNRFWPGGFLWYLWLTLLWPIDKHQRMFCGCNIGIFYV